MKLIGSETIDFEDGDSGLTVQQGSWPLRVAQPRRDLLAGPPLGDVVESFRVDVKGDSGAEVSERLAGLLGVVHESADVERTPVTIVENGRVALLTDLPDGAVEMPETFYANDVSVGPIEVQLKRRGLWLETTPDVATGSFYADNPVVQTATWGTSVAVRCPVDIEIEIQEKFSANLSEGYLIVSSDDDMAIVRSPDSTSTGAGTITTTAFNSAVGGTVHEWNGMSEGDTAAFRVLTSAFASDVNDVIVLASVSANGDFSLQASGNNRKSRFVADSDIGAHTVLVGRVRAGNAIDEISITARAGSSATWLRVDTITLVRVMPETYVIKTPQFFEFTSDDELVTVALTQGATARLTPQLTCEFTGISVLDRGYQGNGYVYLSGDSVSALYLSNTNSAWRIMDGTETTSEPSHVRLKATRLRGHLLP